MEKGIRSLPKVVVAVIVIGILLFVILPTIDKITKFKNTLFLDYEIIEETLQKKTNMIACISEDLEDKMIQKCNASVETEVAPISIEILIFNTYEDSEEYMIKKYYGQNDYIKENGFRMIKNENNKMIEKTILSYNTIVDIKALNDNKKEVDEIIKDLKEASIKKSKNRVEEKK